MESSFKSWNIKFEKEKRVVFFNSLAERVFYETLKNKIENND
jgi:hypothetical protein